MSVNATEWFARLEVARALTRPRGVEPLRAEFHPHQLSALSAFLGRAGEEGLVIADEVGTGKTYAAGHIIRHAVLNSGANRILVLCPGRLTDAKWRMTLRRDFGLLNATRLRGDTFSKWLRQDGDVHVGLDIAIASYHLADATLDVPELIDLEAGLTRLDLLVIDEAQHLYNDLNRRALCELASRLADRRVILTATPIYRGVEDLDVLHRLARPHGEETWDLQAALENQREILELANSISEGGPRKHEAQARLEELGVLVGDHPNPEGLKLMLLDTAPLSSWMVKTRSEQVGKLAKRSPILHLLPLAEDDASTEWSYNANMEIRVPDSRSIYQAVRKKFRNHVHALMFESSPEAFLGDQVNDDQLEDGPVVEGSPLNVREWVAVLRDRDIDPKPNCLKDVILQARNEGRRGTVVYSHYARTQQHLRTFLQGVNAGWVGLAGTNTDDDQLLAAWGEFQQKCSENSEEHPVLIISDKLSEGIDLQCADSLIVYDCGSNPMKLEQLVGRIDRLGQIAESVNIHFLAIEGSVHLENLKMMSERVREYEQYQGKGRPLLPTELEGVEAVAHDDEILTQLRLATMERAMSDAARLDLSGFEHDQLPEGFDVGPDEDVMDAFETMVADGIETWGGSSLGGVCTFPERIASALVDHVGRHQTGKLPPIHAGVIRDKVDRMGLPMNPEMRTWLLTEVGRKNPLQGTTMQAIGERYVLVCLQHNGQKGYHALKYEKTRWAIVPIDTLHGVLKEQTFPEKRQPTITEEEFGEIKAALMASTRWWANGKERLAKQRELRKLAVRRKRLVGAEASTSELDAHIDRLVRELSHMSGEQDAEEPRIEVLLEVN